MTLKTSISISTAHLLSFKGKDVTLSDRAARDIKVLLAAEAKIAEIKAQLEAALIEEMEERNTVHIERDDLVINKRITGHKYAFDPKNKVDAKYTKTVSYQAVNSELVEAYKILKGKLPKGVVEQGRKISLSIKYEK